ncbi:phosphoglycolate phosphatase/pyrophosphatase PpaX [Hydrogenispora ethanolica]|uniref:Phosphoglycolate phosphatase/pyrophosphatase PpaX n=1 Tax=Hydrogenispora ethanolica TaxID=1082276 RepID=A0A4R1R9Q2_HYDET|nr:HAD family hydrolase [Hydrogenispora ethanolica]TCL62415.1 phosphoglycolate phosphatase/pyrophosphatase PpaX [Hydrogenispora ethanolica]
MRLKGFISDLDGTLLNTLPICCHGFRRAFVTFLGREYSDAEIQAWFGPSEEGIIKKLVPHAWQECLDIYLQEYEKAHQVCAEPFPGLKEILDSLLKQGVKLGIVSGKGPQSMAISLAVSGLRDFFEEVATGSESGVVKADQIREMVRSWGLEPSEVAYLGDTAYDIRAAREAGVIPLAAAWADTAQVQEMTAAAPAALFKTSTELGYWLETHGGLEATAVNE